jgi:hypothetical protein
MYIDHQNIIQGSAFWLDDQQDFVLEHIAFGD